MVRKPTVASVFFAQAVLSFIAWRLYDPRCAWDHNDAPWAVLWLAPMVVAHRIQSWKALARICVGMNVFAATISTAVRESFAADTTLCDQAVHSLYAESLFIFPPLKAWWGQLFFAVLAAPLYALVGLAYAATCWDPSDSTDARSRDCVELATAVSKTDSPAAPQGERATDRPPRWALPAMLLYGAFLWALAEVLQRLI